MKKKLTLAIIAIMAIISIATTSFGFNVTDLTGTQKETESLVKAGNGIIRVISTAGVIVSVIALILLGIKYMMGSVEEKATYKKTLMPYMIGAILVFAASIIAQLIYNLAIQL